MDSLTSELQGIYHLSLQLPKKDLQYLILTDSFFYAAGCFDGLRSHGKAKKKIVRTGFFGTPNRPTFFQGIFNSAQPKILVYAKDFLVLHFALDNYAPVNWGVEKPLLILTDNKNHTRILLAKRVPVSLWNEVYHILTFNFALGNIQGRANLAAD